MGLSRSQDAFILNLSQHWFPLRKFASSKRWYNLNSFNDAPQHVSELYLGLTLNQAETEGYSVFVLRSLTESSSESILHTSRADRVAGQLGGSASAGSSAFAGEERSTGSSGGVDWGSYGNFEGQFPLPRRVDSRGRSDPIHSLHARYQMRMSSSERPSLHPSRTTRRQALRPLPHLDPSLPSRRALPPPRPPRPPAIQCRLPVCAPSVNSSSSSATKRLLCEESIR